MEKLNQSLRDNGIDFKSLGFKQLKVFIDSLNLFQIAINDRNQGFVKLKHIFCRNKTLKLNRDELLAIKSLKSNLINTYKVILEKQGEVHLSTFFNAMSIEHKFNHKKFGYSSFTDFMNEIDIFDFNYKADQSFIILK